KDRYETGVEAAKFFKPNTEKLYLATGWNFADALSGAALAAKYDTGILLTNNEEVHAAVKSYLTDTSVGLVTALGSEPIVGNDILKEINQLIK
ncbi:cell wall-binding repeat-containing protein, partial [Bacillus sp. JJ1562]|uniref:cell wall-binding repeat-containing protein n=1 Tax=Bacillus sp. JJ1562 TaxID=3122960 RepID=UPI00300375FD